MKKYDYIIIGAGLYGLHTARYLGNKGCKVLILEAEGDALTQASYVNQARVHNGYHYPRSFQTAIKSKEYYNRFINDFGFAINDNFQKIYAIAEKGSKTSPFEFELFCKKVGIPCNKISNDLFFKKGISATYETLECSFDSIKIKDFIKEEVSRRSNIDTHYYYKVDEIKKTEDGIVIGSSSSSEKYGTKNIINATYSGINQIHNLLDLPLIDLKYELTEIALCSVSKNIRGFGLTVMDGDFFSLMPFGIGGKFSLSHVKYTPHEESFGVKPDFKKLNNLYGNPETNFPKMLKEAKKYLNEDIEITYDKSLYTTKVVLASAELDDARPTFLRKYDLGNDCNLITVFSGKINTIYEIEDFLKNNNT